MLSFVIIFFIVFFFILSLKLSKREIVTVALFLLLAYHRCLPIHYFRVKKVGMFLRQSMNVFVPNYFNKFKRGCSMYRYSVGTV